MKVILITLVALLFSGSSFDGDGQSGDRGGNGMRPDGLIAEGGGSGAGGAKVDLLAGTHIGDGFKGAGNGVKNDIFLSGFETGDGVDGGELS